MRQVDHEEEYTKDHMADLRSPNQGGIRNFYEAMRQVDHEEEDIKDDIAGLHSPNHGGIRNGYDGDDDDDSSGGYTAGNGGIGYSK
jgi:hypothetical protein